MTHFILFIIGTGIIKKSLPPQKNKIYIYLLGALFFLFSCIEIIANSFTGTGFNSAAIYHILAPKQGFDPWITIKPIGIFVATLLFFFLWKKLIKNCKPSFPRIILIGYASLILSILLHPFSQFWIQQASFFSVKAAKTQIISKSVSVDRKKNLVLLYLEGLEQNYLNETLFPGLTPNLNKIRNNSTVFTEIHGTGFGGYTIAGFAETQCGIPFIAPINGNKLTNDHSFLPGATCLGDLLKDEGYRLHYLGGAELGFAGKGKFLTSHGYTNVKGRRILSRQLDDIRYQSRWGVYDDSLFSFAKEEYHQLSQGKKPFVLTLLTLDTHNPKGHINSTCYDKTYEKGQNPMLNAVHCSDALVGEFINFIRSHPNGKNTVITILSDHLGLNSTATKRLKEIKRRNLLMINTPNQKAISINTRGDQADTGTTILNSIGFTGQIGQGINLLSKKEQTKPDINKQDILALWEWEKVSDGINIDHYYKKIRIEGESYYPPLILDISKQIIIAHQYKVQPQRWKQNEIRINFCNKGNICISSQYKNIEIKDDKHLSKSFLTELLQPI